MDNYLSVKDVAGMKGVSVATIYSAIRRKKLPTVTIASRHAIRREDAEAYEPGSYAGVQRTSKPRRILNRGQRIPLSP